MEIPYLIVIFCSGLTVLTAIYLLFNLMRIWYKRFKNWFKRVIRYNDDFIKIKY